MNIKKTFFVVALGLAAGLQAQEAAPQTATTAPAAAPAPVAAPAAPAEQAAAQPAAPAPEAAPAEQAAAQPAAETAAAEQTAAQPAAPAPEAAPAPVAAPAPETAPAPEAAPAEQAAAQPAGPEPVPAPAPETAPAEQVAAPAPEAAPADSAAAATAAETAAAEQPAAEATADSVAQAPAAVDSAAAATTAAAEQAAAPAKTLPASPILDGMIHGSAYNSVANEAAGATIGGDMSVPHKMHGHKLAYYEPINEFGAVSFGENTTFFMAFDNSEDLGLFTAGFAWNSFGFSLDLSAGALRDEQTFVATETEAEHTDKATIIDKGSLAGATFSAKFGVVDLALNGYFTLPESFSKTEAPYSEIDYRNFEYGGQFLVSKANNPFFSWTAFVGGLRVDAKTKSTISHEEDSKGIKSLITEISEVSDTSSRIEAVAGFNFGSTVLANENARVYVGLNSTVAGVAFDKIDDIRSRDNQYGLYLAPNIFGEVALSKYFMMFAGATHQWAAFEYRDAATPAVEIKSMDVQAGATEVNLGARVQYNMFAVELSLADSFIRNPFGAFSDTHEIGANIGAFINF
ncbi:MAG: hypothetical protein MJY78_07530 [Fibrobacter sp.]|nr:hypothetical protein [Fibrobacter sp.]